MRSPPLQGMIILVSSGWASCSTSSVISLLIFIGYELFQLKLVQVDSFWGPGVQHKEEGCPLTSILIHEQR